MAQAIIQPSRIRRVFDGWCHGLFAGQQFRNVLNLGCGHDSDRQGYFYSGYFDAQNIVKVDIADRTTYPDYEICLHGGDAYVNPIDETGNAENLFQFKSGWFDMVFCNWVIYGCDYVKALNGKPNPRHPK